ncbi:MAG: PilZ domain-containing protein [Chromatiaceae bacterium]
MEHRYSPRVQGALDVEISCKGRHLGRFRTRDVSFEGMFFETGAADLEPNDFLGLSLKVNGQSYSMRGVVVHGSREGVGVMLVGEYLGYCRLILDAIDRGALHVPAQPVTTPAAAALRDQARNPGLAPLRAERQGLTPGDASGRDPED